MLRGKGVAEEEEVLVFVVGLEFIGCCCIAMMLTGILNALNGIIITVIEKAIAIVATVDTNGFLIAMTYVHGLIRVIHRIKFVYHCGAFAAGGWFMTNSNALSKLSPSAMKLPVYTVSVSLIRKKYIENVIFGIGKQATHN